MKGTKNKKRYLIGSFSITSATILVVAILAPSLFIDIKSEEILPVKTDWDIIVPDHYDTIYEAIENAETGFKIFVRSGRYYSNYISNSLKIDKMGITLQGQDKNNTEICGRGSSSVINIKADNVVIKGFTLTNNPVNRSLISVYYTNCTIENNILRVKNYVDGIEYAIKISSNENKIIENKIYDADKALLIEGSDNNIISNNFFENNNYGIIFGDAYRVNSSESPMNKIYEKGSNKNTIINNTFSKNNNAISLDSSNNNEIVNNTILKNSNYGIKIAWSTNNVIKNNKLFGCGLEIIGNDLNYYIHEITNNRVNDKPIYYYLQEDRITIPSDAGQIILVDCSYITIEETKISNTSTAVVIAFSNHITIRNCEFSENYRGIYLYYSNKCNIRRNNFIKNSIDARFISLGFLNSRSNKWNNNYWDSWLGTKSLLFRFTNKRIPGRFHLQRRFRIMDKFQLGIRTRNIDRFPKINPYNI